MMSNEDLIELKLSVKSSEKDIGFIKEELKRTAKVNRTEHDALKDTLESYLTRIEKTCARKFVEHILVWGGSIVGTIALSALAIGAIKMIADNLG